MAGLYFYGKREGYVLRPNNWGGEDELERVPEGTTIKIIMKRERSISRNGYYWLLCTKIAKALQAMGADYADKEWVSDSLKCATGHCTMGPTPYAYRKHIGPWMPKPKSIDFDSMDDLEFRHFVEKCEAFICTDILPHIPLREVQAEIRSLMDPAMRKEFIEAKKGLVAA